MNPNKRKEDESFVDYKARLKKEQAIEKQNRKNPIQWDSSIKPKT